MGDDRGLWRERLGAFMEGGAAVIVATCDDSGHPGLTRGWGPTMGADDAVRLAVTARRGSPTAAHLAEGADLSVTVSEMTTYNTMQLLGTIDAVAPIDDDAQERVDLHLERFAEDAAKVGVARNATSLFLDDLIVVRFTVLRATEQTPGELAGTPLEQR